MAECVATSYKLQATSYRHGGDALNDLKMPPTATSRQDRAAGSGARRR
eukprot:SAG11_NODE_22580_length_403_cov_1.289474_1_plen_47_part_10